MENAHKSQERDSLNDGLGVALAVLLSALIVGFLAYQEGFRGGTELSSTEKAVDTAAAKIDETCVPLDSEKKEDCIRSIVSGEYEASLGKQDLSAQQWMVRWAAVLTLITALTTLISWIALTYLRATLSETRRAVADTSKATEAVVDANAIAKESNHRSLRAYIAVKSIVFQESTHDPDSWQLLLELNNTGQTPATITLVKLWAVWSFKGGQETLFDIKSKNGVQCHRETPMHFPFDFEAEGDGLEQEGHLVVMGRVDYTDVYGAEQREVYGFQTPNNFLNFFELDLPCRLSAFSPKSILDQIDAEKKRRKSMRVSQAPLPPSR